MTFVLTENNILKMYCLEIAITEDICKPKASVDKNDNPIRFYTSCSRLIKKNQARNIFVFLIWEEKKSVTYFDIYKKFKRWCTANDRVLHKFFLDFSYFEPIRRTMISADLFFNLILQKLKVAKVTIICQRCFLFTWNNPRKKITLMS